MGKDVLKEGDPVWARHDGEAWVRGHVAERKGDTFKVRMERGGSTTVSVDDVEYCSTTPAQEAKVEDMTHLPDLHHPSLLACLNERFNKDKIYTYTGPILIAVNPFKPLKSLYDSKRMLTYLNAEQGARLEMAPHAWNLAHNAFQAMIDHNGRNQSVLVSGESGAGKTVSTKIVMNYLTVVSSGNYAQAIKATASSRARSSGGDSSTAVAQRVLEANPLMESFGNAKTLRNDNSSRFGKLIQLQFDERNYRLVGAAIDIYLLEKSRVVNQVRGERNYHIFYELEAGLSSKQKSKYNFPDLRSCRYTSMSGTFKRADVGDSEQFALTKQAFDVIGFTGEEQDDVFRMVVAILHLGNIDFEADDSGGEEGSRVARGSESSLASCADLLRVDAEQLAAALTTRNINVGGSGFAGVVSAFAGLARAAPQGEQFMKRHTVTQATQARDGMAQTLYERLFSWLVWRINESISLKSRIRPASERSAASSNRGSEREYYDDYSIGCLDIFGFEVFEKNSFEQLLINYTNEQLQNQFNEFVFELEQQEYEAEGIDWTVIDFPNNTGCLEMIEKRPIGLLSLIDEECLYPNGTDQTLAAKLYQNLARGQHKDYFIASREEQNNFQFIINHFAGEVVYDVESFCAKNKNELRQQAVDLLRSSKTNLYAILLPPNASSAGGGASAAEYFSQLAAKPKAYRSSLERHRRLTPTSSKLQSKTVSSHFKTQLKVAMNHIRASEPHYIRCLKSNDRNVAQVFDRIRIEEQLCYSGVLEVVKVARAGYSTRFPLNEFAVRFSALAHKNARTAARKAQKSVGRGSARDECEKICANSGLQHVLDFQIGNTKVFLKPHAYSSLEILKAEALRQYIVLLQRAIRAWLVRHRRELREGSKRRDREERKRREEEERQRKAEEARLLEEVREAARKRKADEKRRLEEEQEAERLRRAEEKKRLYEEEQEAKRQRKAELRRQQEEERRARKKEEAELRRQQEEKRRARKKEEAELRRQQDEERRARKREKAEARRAQEEELAARRRIEAERAKQASLERRRKDQEARRAREEKLRAEEARRREEKLELRRLEKEAREAREKLKQEERAERKRLELLARRRKEDERMERKLQEEEERERKQRERGERKFQEHQSTFARDDRRRAEEAMRRRKEIETAERKREDLEARNKLLDMQLQEVDERRQKLNERTLRERRRVEERRAAIEIQRVARGMLLRMRLGPILQEHHAARKIRKAFKHKVMKERLHKIREESTQQRAAVMLQGTARVVRAQKLANNLYAERAAQKTARTMETIARAIAAHKTDEMLEQEEEVERSGERDEILLYGGPLLLLMLAIDPNAVASAALVVAAALIGGGLMLERRGDDDFDDNDDDLYGVDPEGRGAGRSRRHDRRAKPRLLSRPSRGSLASSRSSRSSQHSSKHRSRKTSRRWF